MKKTTFSSAAIATLFLTIIGVDNAYALPSFARQTGLSCTMCHAGGQFPALTEMGRQSKLGGYTMGGGETKMPLPLAAMVQVAMSSTKIGSDATAAASANGVNENNKINFPQMSVFYGGKIYDNFGAFVQITYDSSDLPKDLTTRRISADNTDIRYGNSTTLLNNSLVYGASLTNNPTLQDIYASTPAWGFPWATPAIAASIPGPMIENLGHTVIGMNAYGLYADTLYAEFGGYQDSYARNDILKNLTFNNGPVGLQSGNDGVLDGTAPYLRLALQHTFGDNFFMIGGYGSKMNIKQAGTNQLDEYTDVALDGEYQYIADTHSLTLTARNTWEKQTLNGSNDGGVNANLHQSLSVFSAMAAYTFDSKYGVNLGYNQASGSGYVSSQDSSAYLIEAAYTPIESVRIVLQGMIFTKINGQTGSAASDNNTITLGAWLMF